jgi:hypothetical protein
MLFNVASLVRLEGYAPGVTVSAERVNTALAFDLTDYVDSGSLMRPVFDRTGYLDYATVMVAGVEHYAPVVNVGYYLKSLIDNLLTPGFDIFDTPKVSLTIRFLPKSDPPTQAIARAEYSSSQLTAYGEMYVLFRGYWPLVVISLGLMGYLFARLFARVRSGDAYHSHLYRAVVLLAFYNWLNSFGMDWMVIEATSWIATLLFFEAVVVPGGAKRLIVGRSAPRP